jgi:hypothetical protein
MTTTPTPSAGRSRASQVGASRSVINEIVISRAGTNGYQA